MPEQGDFVEFQRRIATQCHVLLPLVDPSSTPQYFHDADDDGPHQTKLTGFVSQAVAYRLPMVAHVDLKRIYQDYWTAPVIAYGTPSRTKTTTTRPFVASNHTTTTITTDSAENRRSPAPSPSPSLTDALRQAMRLWQQEENPV